MNTTRSKAHHAWRPRMNSDHEFNPFVRSNESDEAFQHRAIDDSDESVEWKPDSKPETSED